MRVCDLEDWPEPELLEWSIYLKVTGEAQS
ncbi:hypothetical protein PsAD2_00402 [Pseudovibrio axinellae]|uniref:Uncharacterized protein n=1 Tax=Pseudovibrio axinellae TaxID=989403 RepID=A0A166AHI5_9HYPH|nr:hypothetical protein PsAD2_00402 [Pseudovibrio axinellae]SEQ88267.1 hypothetical protein SAMN05421798_1056 [Pseudovibrio axinellae]